MGALTIHCSPPLLCVSLLLQLAIIIIIVVVTITITTTNTTTSLSLASYLPPWILTKPFEAHPRPQTCYRFVVVQWHWKRWEILSVCGQTHFHNIVTFITNIAIIIMIIIIIVIIIMASIVIIIMMSIKVSWGKGKGTYLCVKPFPAQAPTGCFLLAFTTTPYHTKQTGGFRRERKFRRRGRTWPALFLGAG